METAFYIYLYTTLLSVKLFLIGLIPVLATFTLIGALAWGIALAVVPDRYYTQEGKEQAIKDLNTSIINGLKQYVPYKTILALLILSILTPSTDDMKLIIGGAVGVTAIQKASDIKGIDKLPENVVGAINTFLEELQTHKE